MKRDNLFLILPISFLLFLVMFFSVPVSAKLYIYYDENGVKRYTNEPPLNPDIKYQEKQEIQSNDEVIEPTPEPAPTQKQTTDSQTLAPDIQQSANDQRKEQITNAYHSLLRIKSATTSGVIWKEYVSLVNEANFQLSLAKEKHSSWQKQQGIYEDSYYKLESIYNIYDDVKTLWGEKISNNYSSIQSLVKQYRNKYKLNFLHSDIQRTSGYNHDKAVEIVQQDLWGKATNLLNEYR